MNTADKATMISFMEERFFCMIATVGADSRPEAAFVGYTSSDSHEIIIGTSRQSRKFKNISENSSVAIVIADMSGEVQYEGEVEIITPDDYDKLIAAGRFKKLGGYDKYRNDPTQVYLRIKPTWIRFIVHGEDDQIMEFTEFA